METSKTCAIDCFRDEKIFDQIFYSPRHLHLGNGGNSSTELVGGPVVIHQDEDLFHWLCTNTINPEYQTFFQMDVCATT